MLIRVVTFILFGLLVITGCNSNIDPTVIHIQSTITATVPVATRIKTSRTPILPTVTQEPLITPRLIPTFDPSIAITNIPSTKIIDRCVQSVSSTPVLTGINLVMEDSSILDVKTGKSFLPPTDDYMVFSSISPDHTRVLFIYQLPGEVRENINDWDHIPAYLMIVTPHGVLQKIDWQENWLNVDWFDDRNLAVTLKNTPIGRIEIFNLDTNSIERQLDLNVSDRNIYTFRGWRAPINYDPIYYNKDHTYAVFFESSYIVLWDVHNQKMLSYAPARFPESVLDRSYTFDDPVWSSTGDSVLFSTYLNNELRFKELYLMKTDGSVTRLTHFEDSTPGSQLNGFIWTEEPNQIAYWFAPYPIGPESPDDPGYQLILQDISTGKMTNTCITCSLTGTCSNLSTTILNSVPDQNAVFVVISANAEDINSELRTYLFDIDRQTLSKIAPGYMLGWIKN